MPSVFVLMPFREEFTPVYSSLIKPVLESQGFDVARADEIDNTQPVMRDVVEGIWEADLIIADLTGFNPNVFLELGIAHTLRKLIIHITQDPLENLPFDLRPLRVIRYYDRDFAQMKEFEATLNSYATRFHQGTLRGRGLVEDAYPELRWTFGSSPEIDSSDDPEPEDSGDVDEPGFFDHMAEATEGYTRIGEIAEWQTTCVGRVGEYLQDATKALESIDPNNQSSPSAYRTILRRLAQQLAPLNGEIESGNAEFSAITEKTEDSLEFVLSFTVEHGDLTDPDLTGLIGILKSFRETAQQAREEVRSLRSIIEAAPQLERRLNRETYRLSQAMAVIDDNFSRVIASISRALDKLPPETIEGSP